MMMTFVLEVNYRNIYNYKSKLYTAININIRNNNHNEKEQGKDVGEGISCIKRKDEV